MEGPLKILIVDDDETILSLLEEVFRSDPSLLVTTLSDSERAARVISERSFDLIITDLMMPKIDGLTLLNKAVAVNPEVLVVIITGYASLETTLRAIHGGVYDYITKPFRIEEFRLLVNNAATRIRLIRENKALREENAALRQQLDRERRQQPDESRKAGQAIQFQPTQRQEFLVTDDDSSPILKDRKARSHISSYERSMETPEERYDREIRHLEELFFAGRLTPEVFESLRQRLRSLL